jgi:hypothetical protein
VSLSTLASSSFLLNEIGLSISLDDAMPIGLAASNFPFSINEASIRYGSMSSAYIPYDEHNTSIDVSALLHCGPHRFDNADDVNVDDYLPQVPEPVEAEAEPKVGQEYSSPPSNQEGTGILNSIGNVVKSVVEYSNAFLDSAGYYYSENADNIQRTLDASGFVVPLADGGNALINGARGKYFEAGVNAVAIIPGLGDSIKAGYMAAKGTDAAADVVKVTGQLHHPITTKVFRSLTDNSNVSAEFRDNYKRFTTQAADLASHNGYQTWHREIDKAMENWLAKRPKATETEIIDELKRLYSDPDISKRFPNFHTNLNNWRNSLKK